MVDKTKRADPEVIDQIKLSPYNHKDTRWAAYENHDLGHPEQGQLQFLAIGPNNTYTEAPKQMPDSHLGIGWRYRLIGFLDLETGEVQEKTETN